MANHPQTPYNNIKLSKSFLRKIRKLGYIIHVLYNIIYSILVFQTILNTNFLRW